MRLSRFGRKFTGDSGTLKLMDDLGEAFGSGREMINLGGGNPSHIPRMEETFRAQLAALAQRPGELERAMGDYSGPSGDRTFRGAVADLLRAEHGWDVGPDHVCVTNGSQAGFFALFNLLAGPDEDGGERRILLPMAPEYIGYADIGVGPGLFVSHRPSFEFLEDRFFKYRVDLDDLEVRDDIAALCVSRPTNPTGNVLTDDELASLHGLARERDIPLILDNAYGVPFPGILFRDVRPLWDESVILFMSLSKLGLPGLRTGIVVADPALVRALASANALMTLAPCAFGPALVRGLFESGEVIALSREVVRPHYEARAARAAATLLDDLQDCDVLLHRPEGAIFLWLWCRGIPVSSAELYERLKRRGVVVVSGEHFFPGLEHDPWPHKSECMRLTYSDSPEKVETGLAIVAEEVRRAYREG